jgi:hypothetical protein
MALLPMGPETDQFSTQESMFEEPSGLRSLQAYEPEAAYEAAEEFYQEIPEPEADDLPEMAAQESETQESETQDSEQPVLHTAAASADAESTGPVLDPAATQTTIEAPSEASEETTPESGQDAVFTADDFAALEERILRAVALVRSERQARLAAEERAAGLEAQFKIELEAKLQAQSQLQAPTIEHLQQEVDSLRGEREQVRQRVERLLTQLDALEL